MWGAKLKVSLQLSPRRIVGSLLTIATLYAPPCANEDGYYCQGRRCHHGTASWFTVQATWRPGRLAEWKRNPWSRSYNFCNDVTQSALFARLFLLAKGVRVIHCVGEKGAVGVVPVSCCAVNCTNRFKRDSGIGFYTIPAKQVRREAWLRAISRAGWEAKSSDHLCGEHFVSGRPSRDPKNVDYVTTLFKDGKRRANCSVPDRKGRKAQKVS